ncbi:hypothetical protein G5714_019372 [Onychostoma macrolepis]|uniref:Cation efflux protein transmembrane domain-containing protein n=1 Tax=Onychostoma macrolepis TaxID=369639 RepID=A0A7J6BW85_9TELE|nr:hypothetical protein G5714_019372 [Onychostoma macrolepis]
MACAPNRVRLLCMLSLTFGFFIVEVVVSRITSSLAMLSDSFHMLSDVIALVVALVAVRFAEQTQSTNKNTFGWIRAEVMGALVNAVFLTALCFTIILEAVERFTEPHEIEKPEVVIGVGAAGLLVNLVGLCLFHGHAGGADTAIPMEDTATATGTQKHKNGKVRRCHLADRSANRMRVWAWPDAKRVPCGKFTGPGAKFQPSADERQKTSTKPDQRVAYRLPA